MTQAPVEHVTSEAGGPPENWRPDASTFGARLALIRQHLGWGNVKEAATECGVPAETWRSWESGGTPRQLAEVARRISDRTRCDYLWLMLGDDAPERAA